LHQFRNLIDKLLGWRRGIQRESAFGSTNCPWWTTN